jgi:hypothetical protein
MHTPRDRRKGAASPAFGFRALGEGVDGGVDDAPYWDSVSRFDTMPSIGRQQIVEGKGLVKRSLRTLALSRHAAGACSDSRRPTRSQQQG